MAIKVFGQAIYPFGLYCPLDDRKMQFGDLSRYAIAHLRTINATATWGDRPDPVPTTIAHAQLCDVLRVKQETGWHNAALWVPTDREIKDRDLVQMLVDRLMAAGASIDPKWYEAGIASLRWEARPELQWPKRAAFEAVRGE